MTNSAAKVEVQPWMKEAAADIWPDNNPAFQAIGITASESVAVINMQQWERIAEIISRHAPAPDLTTHLAKYRDAMDAIYNDSEAGRELVTKHFGLTHPVVEPDAHASEWEWAIEAAHQCAMDEFSTSVEEGNNVARQDACDNIMRAIRALRRPLPTD